MRKILSMALILAMLLSISVPRLGASVYATDEPGTAPASFETMAETADGDYFRVTYIGENPTELRNRYLILNFDFSGVNTDTPEGLVRSFGNITRRSIDMFAKKYGVDYACPEDIMPSDMLDGLLSAVETKTQTPVYVVIDEYDHFANELLSFRIDLFKESVSKTGFVRKWFEILKKYTATIINRIFATGVSPITLDILTSGFNIASDITMNARFNETHIHLIMYAYLNMSQLFTVKSEYEVPGGYIDIALLPNNRYSVDFYAMIELKHIKKGEYNESGDKCVVNEEL
jgi:hypothetical protein